MLRDADHHLRVHDDLLDGGAAALALGMQIGLHRMPEKAVRGLDAPAADAVPRRRSEHGTETARIAQARAWCVIEEQSIWSVQTGQALPVRKAQAARHAKVWRRILGVSRPPKIC